MPLTQYVILRRATSIGVQVAQAIHAATECLRTAPVPSDTFVVALEAADGDVLRLLHDHLAVAGVHHVMICEPDPPFNGAPTAIGIEPMDREAVRPFVAHLKLLR